MSALPFMESLRQDKKFAKISHPCLNNAVRMSLKSLEKTVMEKDYASFPLIITGLGNSARDNIFIWILDTLAVRFLWVNNLFLFSKVEQLYYGPVRSIMQASSTSVNGFYKCNYLRLLASSSTAV